MNAKVLLVATAREQLLHSLYEAAELEHNLMCTYLYAAFSLKAPEDEGLRAEEAQAVERWRRVILQIAVEEMSHLAAVWNITSALGGAPRLGRSNFPLDAGYLPAGIVVKLAPFNADTLQHFVYLERPEGSAEAEGAGFEPERRFQRGSLQARLTPMAMDYETVGTFYAALKQCLQALTDQVGESQAFCGDRALQLSGAELGLPHVKPVICVKTALAAFDSIVAEGEGSPADAVSSHFQKFAVIRRELAALLAANPAFQPAFPAATNPVLRRPPRLEGRVWLEDPRAVATVDLANASYGLMLRLLAYAYAIASPDARKSAALELGMGLMHALSPLAEHAARLPAGPSNPGCNAGVSFTALRDSAAFPVGTAAEDFFRERLREFAQAAADLAVDDEPRLQQASALFASLAMRAEQRFPRRAAEVSAAAPAALPAPASAPAPAVEVASGPDIEIRFEARLCIHSRICVTGAPTVFLANVQGPWIHPETMPVERLVDIAHGCPSGAIRYSRRDGKADESAPPVNLASIREAGPYAFRGDLRLNGAAAGFRATLCRCGASKNKPYCDGSHHEVNFTASGEPATGAADMLPVRDGLLAIDPQRDGPLQVSGNLEITSGTGRVVARLTTARLCRCGGSQSKPFCDGTHAKIGFTAP